MWGPWVTFFLSRLNKFKECNASSQATAWFYSTNEGSTFSMCSSFTWGPWVTLLVQRAQTATYEDLEHTSEWRVPESLSERRPFTAQALPFRRRPPPRPQVGARALRNSALATAARPRPGPPWERSGAGGAGRPRYRCPGT